MQEYADPQMQAMAQVWAHPEDLPLYPVSSSCDLLGNAGALFVPRCLFYESLQALSAQHHVTWSCAERIS